MTTIAWPAGVYPRACSLRLGVTQRAAIAPFGGSEQVTDLLNDRWYLSCTLPPRAGRVMGGRVEAFVAALRGMTNTVNLWHFARPTVLGTLASATCGATTAGVQSLTLTGTGTLRGGDMLGISGQLFQVADDVTLAGATAVGIVNRVRTAISAGTPVTLTRPTAAFRLVSAHAALQHVPMASEPIALDFAEVIA